MYGLVLEGGGSRGAYHIGACKALYELGFDFGIVVGTSVGALNGAMLIQGDLDEAYNLWYNINLSNVISFDDEKIESLNPSGSKREIFKKRVRNIKKVIQEKGINIDPLIEMVSNAVDEEKIRSSKVDFGLVSVDLTQKKAVEVYKDDIPNGKLVDYLIASASFPGFQLKDIDGNKYIDGGFYNAFPINLAINKGFTDIIAIRTYALGMKKKFDTSKCNIKYIEPSEGLGLVLDFDNARARKNLSLGYYDVFKTYGGLKGKKYYIMPYNDEGFFLNYLMNISDEKIENLCRIFGIEKACGKRAIFEFVIPKISSLLGLSSIASYEDISIALLEYFAGQMKLERFKIYSLRELYNELATSIKSKRDNLISNNDDFINEIPGFIRNLDLVSHIIKGKIIERIAAELFCELI